jgi:NACalpha-BTF3-like transcription factor
VAQASEVRIRNENFAFVERQIDNDKPDAKNALEATNGDIAEAILRWTNG